MEGNYYLIFNFYFMNIDISLDIIPAYTIILGIFRKHSCLEKCLAVVSHLCPSFYFMTKKGNFCHFLHFFSKPILLHNIKCKLKTISKILRQVSLQIDSGNMGRNFKYVSLIAKEISMLKKYT